MTASPSASSAAGGRANLLIDQLPPGAVVVATAGHQRVPCDLYCKFADLYRRRVRTAIAGNSDRGVGVFSLLCSEVHFDSSKTA